MLLLGGVLFWEQRHAQTHWSSFLVGNPDLGSKLFFEKKNCAHCHSVNGSGGKLAPDLGFALSPQSNLSQLVSAMWNCAPRMWERMHAEKMRYPGMDQEEMSHLFAFLYAARYVDEPGDQNRGARLLWKKGCIRCHAVSGNGGQVGPDLASVTGVDTPIMWTEAMWNHAPKMEAQMQKLNIAWPKFEGSDMNDLLAYIREITHGLRRESQVLPASPARGWKLFQSKSCIACHAVNGKGGHIGPALGPDQPIPLTIVQFSALMWNHSPEMWRRTESANIARPTFKDQEIADLVAFLSSLRYFEPSGSELIGGTLFVERDCSRCHGRTGEGDRHGPALRGRGKSFTTIGLATALWSHGPNMYQRTKELKVPWPKLAENDVGNLLAFLNSSVKGNE